MLVRVCHTLESSVFNITTPIIDSAQQDEKLAMHILELSDPKLNANKNV